MSVASGISRESPPSLPSSSNFVSPVFSSSLEGHVSRRENSHFGTNKIFRARTRVRDTRVMARITVSGGVVSPRISLSPPLPFYFSSTTGGAIRRGDREKWRDVIDRTLLSDPPPPTKVRRQGFYFRADLESLSART